MESALTALIVIVLLLFTGVKVVREHQRLIVFRLGRSIGQKGPGVVFLIPLIDKGLWLNLSVTSATVPLFRPVSVEEFLKKFPGVWDWQDISGQIVSVVISKTEALGKERVT